MLSLNAALKVMLEKMAHREPVKIELLDALGCISAQDVIAHEYLPSFSNSAMDGFAVRSIDFRKNENIFRVIEDLPAGKAPLKKISSKTIARIMTGAPLPDGADSVVPVEQTEVLPDGRVRFLSSPEVNQFVRLKGEEVRPGDKIISRGQILRPAELGLLASLGLTSVNVISRPTISLITTGSEVVSPSAKPAPGQIRNANLTALSASIKNLECPLVFSKHVNDDPAMLKNVFSKCQSDVIITCGGVSVGERDFVKSVLSKMGEIYFWRVAIKPGKPFVFGKIGRSWFFGLPGNPVSALVTFEVLVKPALLTMAGHKSSSPALTQATLSKPIQHQPGRLEFVRARAEKNGKGWTAEPLPWQGSGMLRSLTEANAWIVVPEKSEGVDSGSVINILRKESEFQCP